MNEADLFGLDRGTIVAFIEDLFVRRGGEQYLGEAVTMAEHMLQGATLAERNRESEEIIVAALLHDIGHFVGGSGPFSINDTKDRFHEEAGARLLEPFFPGVVVDCCRYHVAAKRYLCATDPGYFATLSAASVHSLKLQGGPMNAEEAAEFETRPNRHAIIAVRYLDDAGKQIGMPTRDFAHFTPMLRRMVDARFREAAASRGGFPGGDHTTAPRRR